MTTIPSHLASVGPSPSRNPFARPKLGGTSSSSFSRKTLLPSILSPVKSTSIATNAQSPLATPSSGKSRSAWRLLWRGGLEIGNEGWRLDGITFFALLSFPLPTPSTAKETNPFDVPIQPNPLSTPGNNGTSTPGGGYGPQSPFPLTNRDTDLCLSLESMRGRKYLQIRGMVDLPGDELLEGESEDNDSDGLNGNNIQMSISPQAPLLAAYFTGLLCRNSILNKNGRTLNAILIGLGDEDIDSTNNSTILVYGQKQDHASDDNGQSTLKLCVGKRKPPPPPPSAKKVKPGEPLPRAPLFFPVKSKRTSLFPSRSLSRTSSISSSIYQPPQPQAQSQSLSNHAELSHHAQSLPNAPLLGRSPGRRGEKRPRKMEFDDDRVVDENDRKRKAGKIVRDNFESSSSSSTKMAKKLSGRKGEYGVDVQRNEEDNEDEEEEEDIFGKRGKSITPIPPILMSRTKSTESTGELTSHEQSDGPLDMDSNSINKNNKRNKVPQQVLDNKAVIRKQTLILLENRGIPRTHESFKDVFGMTTKGTYFAFRERLQIDHITKPEIQTIINIHLNMYLPSSLTSLLQSNQPYQYQSDEKQHEEDSKLDKLVKLETNTSTTTKKENYQEIDLEGTFLQKIHMTSHQHHIEYDSKIKLESVVEEEEE
ncbi:uncharacterized protein L201_002904 [Kwoniella dendrophila CBS 6074]|uniref:Sld7 C-terminal domain-containing protein n=1 Tax=Kwoniella dendrophila CBS 6074 TaxID=1295534 RepID=A0AAX4JTY7_9TREE